MKLGGQRIELSEVDYHVRCCVKAGVEDGFAAVAEIVIPQVTGQPTLVVFMQLKQEEKIPMSPGREVDRKRLQTIGANLNFEKLTLQEASSKGRTPITESEVRLEQLWETVLDVPKQRIRAESSFLRLGGDSIAAMRLASLARSQGIFLMVQHVLSAPRLSKMAKAVDNLKNNEKVAAEMVEPFSLLQHPEDKDTVVRQAAEQCGANVSNIEDIFPCTGVQKELLSVTAKRPGDCIATFNLKLREHVDVKRLQKAWEQVSRSKAPILRCRIVDTQMEDGLVQLQVDEALKWDSCHDVKGNRDVTASTIIRAAWSILAAQHTDSDDVVFGALVTGRQAPIEGIERMIAPLIAALRIRITLIPGEQVDDFLKKVHRQSVDMIAYEQTEFLDIRRINADTERATRFNTLLVVQPPTAVQGGFHKDDSESPFESCRELRPSSNGLGSFNPHALLVMCQLSHTNSLDLELSFDSNVVDAAQIERLAAQFEHVLRQTCEPGYTKLEEIDMTSSQDLAELWKWNAHVPDAVQTSVQDRITRAMDLRPEAQAICAWDGTFSYKDIHELSNRLACQLIALGAGNGIIIALCFEKSKWQPVAALGAIKAGAACVALDVQHPGARLRAIAKQVQPQLVLSSASRVGLAGRISTGEVFVVDSTSFSKPHTIPMVNDRLSQRKTCPSDILYVLFTSGSTGVPKGVVMTNEAFSSAVTHQADALLVGEGSRVFDFVSYSFDITWSNLLNTLIRGGCLCVPSEWERMNDFAGAFNRLQANYVHFPPSVAASLAPPALPGLKTLVIGGEPILNHEISHWTQAENILGISGPAECAQGAVSIDPVDANSPNNHVGLSFGARFWLVQPGRPDKLVSRWCSLTACIELRTSMRTSIRSNTTDPLGSYATCEKEFLYAHELAIGAVGELLIEGPTIAQGYLGDPDRTAAAFIDAPKWLRRGAPGHQGRTSRLYKTGDLLRYNSDGTFTFIGRKDGMIKLRGQRIELSEIESQIRSSLHGPKLCDAIAAEMITPRDTESPMIVVFVSLVEMEAPSDTSKQDMQAKFRLALQGVEERLSECLPQYMLPGAYLPLAKMPVTGTNKINRRLLRELGNAQTTKMLVESQLHGQEDTYRAPDTVMEKRLQALWSSVLRTESSSISAESNFFRIRGESIAAMRLVAAARQEHISLTVADIFRKPRLCQLAQVIAFTAAAEEALQPQALLPSEMDTAPFIRCSVFPLLDTEVEKVKDVFPTSAFRT
ncbi:MAG: hypothetical protein Q9181_002274 [Wetmoreana brouardii]